MAKNSAIIGHQYIDDNLRYDRGRHLTLPACTSSFLSTGRLSSFQKFRAGSDFRRGDDGGIVSDGQHVNSFKCGLKGFVDDSF